MCIRHTLLWDTDELTCQRVASLSEYYAISSILRFNQAVLTCELFSALPKTSFLSYLLSLFVFLTTTNNSVHNTHVPTLLRDISALKQSFSHPSQLYRVVRFALIFWLLFLQRLDADHTGITAWEADSPRENWLFVVKIAMSLSATAVMHTVTTRVSLTNRSSTSHTQ